LNPSNSSNLQIVDPTLFPNWDDLLLSTPGYSFFHSSAWARVLKESYGYTPLYFASIENGHFSALIPVMEVNSFITGKRGVSLPFTDYCEPIIDKDQDFADMFNYIIEFGKNRQWKYIELRGGDSYVNNLVLRLSSFVSRPSSLVPASSRFAPCALRLAVSPSGKNLVHTLDLTKGEKALHSGLRDSTRRNIKKAIKESVVVKILNSLESVKEFYLLNCITRKSHGLPPQPFNFFKNIAEYIIAIQSGFIVLASIKGRDIAGAVFFHFGNTAIFKYGASDNKYQHLRANNLVIWEAIKWYCQNDYKSFSLGRTDPENQGLAQFKSGWGGKQENIKYFKYDLGQRDFVNQGSKSSSFSNSLFTRMPVFLSKLISSVIYKHAG
jgi:hypothetical protein